MRNGVLKRPAHYLKAVNLSREMRKTEKYTRIYNVVYSLYKLL